MNHLLSTTTLSIGEIMDLLKDANDFSKGETMETRRTNIYS